MLIQNSYLIFLLCLISCNSITQEKGLSETSMEHFKTEEGVYEMDDRQDFIDVQNSKVREKFQKILSAFSLSDFSTKGEQNDSMQIELNVYGEKYNLCNDVKFWSQPQGAKFTAFAISNKHILTTGHCAEINHEDKFSGELYSFSMEKLKSFIFIFDFYYNGSNSIPYEYKLSKSDVYYPVDTVLYIPSNQEDILIIEVDKVIDESRILRIDDSTEIADETSIYMIGSSSGIPLKYVDNAIVYEQRNNIFFSNLDAFDCNSGSPVFNSNNHRFEGMLVSGDEDYGISKENNNCDDIIYYTNGQANEVIIKKSILKTIISNLK